MTIATVNHRAPDFALMCVSPQAGRRRVTLADYRDRWLGLLFYPRDFSVICPTELTAVSSRIEEFQRRGCDLLGISTDSLTTHEAWIATPKSQGGLGGLNFPLACDEDGSVCRAYGVYVPVQHVALRGLFIIDPNGVLQYAAIHNLSVGRRTDEILRVLAALQTGGLCPENWTEGQRPLDVTQTIGPGSVVGGFRIMERIGGGSFGAVFKAYDTTLERLVALKVLQSGDRDVIRQVLAEARAAAALQHAHVCTVYAVDNSEGMPLIAMEYVAGEALSKRLEAGPLDLEEARRLGRQVAEGMAAAHASGVIHGDLKPANIMVTHAGQAKIMDFGLARRERSRGMADATRSEMADSAGDEEPSSGLSGTPAYMSPEQTRGETLTPASDVFSFGLVLMEMLTGRRLFQSQRLLALFREIEDLNPDKVVERLAEPFRSLLRQALQPQVEQRTLTMADIAGILSIGRPG